MTIGEAMGLRENGKLWTVKEQILEDAASGLTFQFEVVDDPSAPYRLRVYGDLPFGNRDICFGPDGTVVGTGTLVSGLCKPSWPSDAEQV